jgi:hypothetical protein
LPRRSLWCALALALLAALALAEDAAPLAELTVTAFGAQRLDLATGFTELPDGGIVVDQGSGVRLEAPWLRYAEGERLEATQALLAGPFGTMDAAEVVLDLVERRLLVEGGVTLRAGGAVVRARSLRFDADAGWLWASGDVSGDTPTFEAAALGYDTASGRIVLAPPYAYEDGPLLLRAAADGAPLQLTPERDEADAIVGYDASTALDADVAERLAAASEE